MVDNNNKKAFTLVEMLVVIAILGILMALLFPTFTMVMKKAKITKAKTEISQIEQAWKQFLQDYKTLPSGVNSMNSSSVKILTGEDKTENTRETMYMELDPDESYTDPWGSVYNVSLDVSVPQKAYNGDEVHKQVLVWSNGPDEKEGTGDDIKNWH